MRLYQGNAKDLIGKKIDCKVRRFGYYPMTVIVINGDLYVKDAVRGMYANSGKSNRF